jgi:hypothetical protein
VLIVMSSLACVTAVSAFSYLFTAGVALGWPVLLINFFFVSCEMMSVDSSAGLPLWVRLTVSREMGRVSSACCVCSRQPLTCSKRMSVSAAE